MGLYKQEEFVDEGEPKDIPCGSYSTIVLQWRKNKTTGARYLSVGKKTKYPAMENGKAVLKESFKRGGLVIPDTTVPVFQRVLAQFTTDGGITQEPDWVNNQVSARV